MKTRTIDLDIERLRRLPQGDDTWQLAVTPMPQWIVPEDSNIEPYRPILSMCCSLETGFVGFGELAEPNEPRANLALRALTALPRMGNLKSRPATVEVADPALLDVLRELLDDTGIEVRLTDRVGSLDEVIAHLREGLAGDKADLRTFAPEVSIEQIRSFATAAIDFYAAAPWHYLSDADLIHVETRGTPDDMRWFVVMGGAGIVTGLAFFASQRDFTGFMRDDISVAEQFRSPRWSITYDRAHQLSMIDLDCWEEHALPKLGDGRYPVIKHVSRSGFGMEADGPRLAHAEALLRVLTATTEDELDAGRWSRTVPLAASECTLTLALPALLAAEAPGGKPKRARAPGGMPDRRLLERETAKIGRLLEDGTFKNAGEINAYLAANRGKPLPTTPATTAREEAQEMFYAALEERGRLRIKLARDAVRRWPDCADALVLLAEEMSDPVRSTALYRRAMEAGKRELGPAAFVEHRGHFWGVHETRPYMRARHGLAAGQWRAGEREEAIAHWQDMLELSPRDNLGLRYVVIPRLLELGRDADAAAVLAAHDEDTTALMVYIAALVSFRLHGDSAESTRRLTGAARANPHVIKYLLDPDSLPGAIPSAYRLGTEEEAIIVADHLIEAWHATTGAVEWLREHRRKAKKARELGRKKRGGK